MSVKCATDHGYWWHRQHGQQPCRACLTAHDVALAEWNQHRQATQPHDVAQMWADVDPEMWHNDATPPGLCGTPSGYMRHRHEHTDPCEACVDAFYTIRIRPVANPRKARP